MTRQEAIEWAAQIWCRPENAKRTMDVELASSIADALLELVGEEKPN